MAATAAGSGVGGPADTLVLGRVITLAGEHGLGDVEALAITGGRVIVAGSRSAAEALAGPRTRRIQLDPDELVLPGLTDSHLHLADAAMARGELALDGAPTLADGLERLGSAHRSAAQLTWITGQGWAADRWGRWPTAADLESVAPGRLVALWAHDHHALWVSRAALALAGVSAGSTDPVGGAIRRDEHGEPTGILHEAATGLVNAHVPVPTVADYEAALPALCRELIALGVVAVHDPGTLRSSAGLGGPLLAYGQLADRGELPLRVHASIRSEALEATIERSARSGMLLGEGTHGRARFGWLKLFADGSLGSRTAAMLEPLEPIPGSTGDHGIWVTQPEALRHLAARAAEHGIATQIHAIGDSAVRSALTAFEPRLTRSLGLRARIEHAQLVDPADLDRFGQLGVVASIQPVHLRTNAAQARAAWGPRAERSAYAWRSLQGAGATLAFGTDAPVEPVDPWPGLALAITRSWPAWPDGGLAFGPDQALTLDEVLRGACLGPAQAEGATDRGRLVPGQDADLIVVPAAGFAPPIEPGGALAATRPRLVLVQGEPVFEA